MARAARVYRSYEEFERQELHGLEQLTSTIDEMLDGMFAEELDFKAIDQQRARPQRRRSVDDDFELDLD